MRRWVALTLLTAALLATSCEPSGGIGSIGGPCKKDGTCSSPHLKCESRFEIFSGASYICEPYEPSDAR
jgi:hypothetical protein